MNMLAFARVSLAALPLQLLRWPLRRIRWKIVLPYVFLTVVLAVAGSYLATSLVTGSLADRFDNQLAEAGRGVSDAIVRTEREHLEVVRAVAFTEGIAEAIPAADTDRLADLAEPIAVNAAVERLEVLGASGQRMKTLLLRDADSLTYAEINDGDNPSDWALVQRVLHREVDDLGDKHAEITQTSQGYVLYTAGPISLNGQVVGVILVGTSLDSLVKQTKAEALADVTMYGFDGNALASTFARPDSAATDEADLTLGGDALAATTAPNVTIRDNRKLWGRGYDLVYSTLEVRDQPAGLYSVGLPTDFIFNAGTSTRTQIALLFGVGMAAVLGIGLFVAHVFTEPIRKLLETTRLVAEGDLTVRSGVKSSDEIGALAASFDEMTVKLQRQHLATISALTSAIDARDPSTLGHSVRVGQLALMIGRHLELDEKTVARLEIGGYLHDIGKIGIRDAVLLKPGGLTSEERSIINEHPRIGMAILDTVELPEEVVEFVRAHHERLDGSGYPLGLRDDQVSVIARIAAVADIYDALTNERPYRRPSRPEEALAQLLADSGSVLDPRVVEALAVLLPEWERRRISEPALHGFRLPELDKQKVTA
jgi:putative nucleotidyltransferase with HDIG domain